jgi:glycerophosphoryl diester phosphodiesterase
MYETSARRVIRTFAIGCFVSIALAACASETNQDKRASFHIQAHRGAGIARPENTLESFQWSWNLGVTPEADLRTTSDGTIVSFHDANLARVVSNIDETRKQLSIEKLPLSEVQLLEVGSFRGEEFAGQHVPTLASVLAEMRDRPERLLYLDIKTAQLEPLISLIREYGVERQVIFTTTHHRLIRDWKRRVPESLTLLWNGGSEAELETKLAAVRKTDFEGITHLQIHVHVGDLASDEPFMPRSGFLQALGQELKSRGIVFQVLPWECSDPRAYEKLLELGAESFATDYPEITLRAVKEFRNRKEP